VSPIRLDGCATVDVNLDQLAVQEKDSWWGVFFNVTATVVEEGTNIRQSKWKASDVTQMHYDIEFANPPKTFKTVGWKRTKWPDKQYLARNIYEGESRDKIIINFISILDSIQLQFYLSFSLDTF